MTSHRFLGLGLLLLAACQTSADDLATPSLGGKADDGLAAQRGLPADLPAWGGDDQGRWTPEAILANAATAELQRDPAARVSIPVALSRSTFAPYGDGQTNAAASLVWWQHKRAPVVGVRHAASLEVRFDRALTIHEPVIELYTATGSWLRSVSGTRTATGDLVITVIDPQLLASLGDQFVVGPRGWRDAFPLSFALPTTTVDALAATLPAAHRTLPGGEPAVDPVGAAGDDAALVLHATSFPAGFVNQTPYRTDTLHAAFPQGGNPRITAVGGADTWVATTPFENLYVCLDPRNRNAEADYGVPSGAGWHYIGDHGESIVSSLATTPLLVAYAEDVPAVLGSGGGFAYGLDRAATFALLAPGHAFTSPRGTFHWYAVHQGTSPCVQIWKHACTPDPRAPSITCR